MDGATEHGVTTWTSVVAGTFRRVHASSRAFLFLCALLVALLVTTGNRQPSELNQSATENQGVPSTEPPQYLQELEASVAPTQAMLEKLAPQPPHEGTHAPAPSCVAPENWVPELKNIKPDDLVIGLITSPATASKRAVKAANTWKRRSPSPVYFFGAQVGTLNATEEDKLAWTVANLHLPLEIPQVQPLPIRPGRTTHIVNETVTMFRTMLANFPDKKWYMKADDDTYINVPNLLVSLDQYFNASEDAFIGRPIIKNTLNSGGAGYILSRSALEKLLSKVDECMPEVMPRKHNGEDVLVAWCLESRFNITRTLNRGHYMCTAADVEATWRSWHPEGLIEYPVSFHWLKGEDMYLYDYLHAYATVLKIED